MESAVFVFVLCLVFSKGIVCICNRVILGIIRIEYRETAALYFLTLDIASVPFVFCVFI